MGFWVGLSTLSCWVLGEVEVVCGGLLPPSLGKRVILSLVGLRRGWFHSSWMFVVI